MSIILGIDPGSRVTGFGIVEIMPDKTTRYVLSGCIRIKSKILSEKLQTIFDGVTQLMQEYKPSEVSIESIFMHRNAMSALKLGQARGAAIAAVSQHVANVFEYSPRQIKLSVVGYGAALKQQVQMMVCNLLSLQATPQEDAADALAAALCHVYHSSSKKGLKNDCLA